MKKLIISLLTMLTLVSATMFAVGCVNNKPKVCTNHTGGTATCTAQAVCTNCGKSYGEIKEHKYNNLKHNDSKHWYECVCGEKSGEESHKGGTATETTKAVCEVCNEEYGQTLNHTHEYKTLKSNVLSHWYECSCGSKSGEESHKGGTATETTNAVCDICGESYGELLTPTEGLEYRLINNDTEYEVVGYTGTSTEVYIPSTYNGKPVTSICGEYYQPRYDGTGEYDADGAFSNCDYIKSVTIPYSIKKIGVGAFAKCGLIETINIENNQLLNFIGNYAFADCTALQSIEIPSTVITLGEGAFMFCETLQSVTFEKDSQLTSIGKETFAYCTSLKAIEIPASVISISYFMDVTMWPGPFYACESLENVTFEENSQLTSIGDYAFCRCESLQAIEIPDSVTIIGDFAFSNCYKLNLTFEKSSQLTSIGNLAFYNCSSLTSIEIPDSVTSIGDAAFVNCNALTHIVIPDSVTSMGYRVFAIEHMDEIESAITKQVNYLGTLDSWFENRLSNAFDFYYSYNGTPYNLYINGQLLTEVKLTNENILNYAIANCASIKKIVLADDVTKINTSAFCGCESLQEIEINLSVTSIDIGQYTFYNCTALTSIKVAEGNQYYKEIDGNLYSKDGKTLILYAIGKKDTLFSIPSGVTSISKYAFSGCESLQVIEMPASVISIGSGAFSDCYSLTKVNYLGTIDSWVQIEFASNPLYYAKNLYINNQLVTEANITTATKINSSAFENCESLQAVEIPDSVTSIGDGAFRNCSSLQYNVKDGLKYLGNKENKYLYLAGVESQTITNATIDANCRFIGSYAFENCSSLTSIEIPDSVTSIGNYAFLCCYSLQRVYLPKTVEIIGFAVFTDCGVYYLECGNVGGYIYCEATSKPEGWDDYWLIDFRNYNEPTMEVVWGYTGQE